MKTLGTILGNIFGALLALALTAALGYYGFIAAKRFVVLFAGLDFTVAMVTATATAGLLLGAIIIAGSVRRASAKGREMQLRIDKAEAYKHFIKLWDEMLRPGQSAEAVAQLSKLMQEVNHLLLLHGSPAMVKMHAAMPGLSLGEAREHLADALLLIRKDLATDSRGLDGKDLLQLIVSEREKVNGTPKQAMRPDAEPRVSLAPN